MGSYRLYLMEIQWNTLALIHTTKSNDKSKLAELLETSWNRSKQGENYPRARFRWCEDKNVK